MHFNSTRVQPIADRISFMLILLLSCTLLFSTSWADDENPAEGSALDSIEELVDELEDESELSDDDLSAAIKAEETQEPDPEPEPDESEPAATADYSAGALDEVDAARGLDDVRELALL